MRYFQDAAGGVMTSVRDYDIAADTAIESGQVLVLSTGLITKAAAAVTSKIIGVAAEGHSGSADALNMRSSGTRISVNDSPSAIFACPAPIITATGGSSTTVIDTGIASFANDDFNGGYLMLIEKAAGSENTDAIGSVRRVTDFVAADKTFTLAEGGTPSVGDKYAVFPPIGFGKGNLDTNRTKLVLTATASLPLKVVGRLEGTREILMMAALHELANKSA